MNYFLGHDVYSHAASRGYDYVIRLDSDVSFTEQYNALLRPQLMELATSAATSTAGSAWRVDVAFAALGMPEIGVRANVEFLRSALAYFLQRGILSDAGDVDSLLHGQYGMHDTIYAGPVEVFRRAVFDSPLYRAFFAHVGMSVSAGRSRYIAVTCSLQLRPDPAAVDHIQFLLHRPLSLPARRMQSLPCSLGTNRMTTTLSVSSFSSRCLFASPCPRYVASGFATFPSSTRSSLVPGASSSALIRSVSPTEYVHEQPWDDYRGSGPRPL